MGIPFSACTKLDKPVASPRLLRDQGKPAKAAKPVAEEKDATKLKPDTETAWMDFATLSTDFRTEFEKVKAELPGLKLNPYARQLIPVGGTAPSSASPAALTFSLMQFNVLADGLSGSRDDTEARVDAKGFILSPPACLPWRVRGFVILDEIARRNPDVVCLQEVDQFKFFAHFLAPLGYEGRGKAKDKSPCVKVGKKYGLALPPDGTAIFWKTNKLELVKAHEAFPDMPHEQAVQLLHLRSKGAAPQDLLVGVMHLKSKKKAEGERLRLEQLLYLMPRVRQVAKEAGDLPIFIGCDLNAESGFTPIGAEECDYEPYAYQSLLAPADLHKGAAENADLAALLKEKAYKNGYGLALGSAYRSASPADQEPLYTTWKERAGGNAKHTIDYIFFQPRKGVRVTHLLSIPTEDEVNQETYLPGWEYPSDHFAIQATFEIDAPQ